jgi:hypothetical protein
MKLMDNASYIPTVTLEWHGTINTQDVNLSHALQAHIGTVKDAMLQ